MPFRRFFGVDELLPSFVTAERWSWDNPVRIFAGSGTSTLVAELAPLETILLVTTHGFVRRGQAERIVGLLAPRDVVVYSDVQPNPDIRVLETAVSRYQGQRFAGIVALGGGSAIDSAKVIAAALQVAPRTVRELVSGAVVPTGMPTPVLAMPTTAGTGSEVTPFATVWDHSGKRKLSLAGQFMFPSTAILDPELTTSAPNDVATAAGLDALSQACEAIWNRNATPVTNALALRAAQLAFDALPLLSTFGSDLQVRSAMMDASVMAGLAISTTRTAVAHSISYPITAHFGVPHGIACSFTLPAVLEFNSAEDDGRLDWFARGLGSRTARDLGDRLRGLLGLLKVPEELRTRGVTKSAIEELGSVLLTPGRSENNMRRLSHADALRVAQESLESD